MSPHGEVFERVKKVPSMYVIEDTYAAVVAFVTGYDVACEGGVLEGFREWLLLRLDDRSWDNVSWPGLVRRLAFPAERSEEGLSNPEAHRHAIDTLFDLIAEFDKARAEREGLRRIFVSYTKWLQERPVGS